MISTPLSVNAVRLNQLLWNATLFTTKTGATEGRVFFSVRVGAHWDITMFACDDFIVVQDSVAFSVTEQENAVVIEPMQFTISVADLKEFEKATRDIKENIDITIMDGHIGFVQVEPADSGETEEVVYSYAYTHPGQVWGYLIELTEAGQEFSGDFTGTTFYINPDRFKQIPRMKIEGDHPLAFRYGQVEEQQMIGFRYGPTVRGTITSMDIEKLIAREVHIWPHEDEEVEPYVEVIPVGGKVTVGGIEFTKISDVPFEEDGEEVPLGGYFSDEEPPWDTDGPTNIDTNDGKDLQGVRAKDWKPTRVEYMAAVDPDVMPDHVDPEGDAESGF